ncbi:uncharacterized protein LOC143052605 [Mytilus galloprovincialis]
MGVIKGKTDNFGFPLWEIQLEGGKLVTEARYRFDIISEPDRTVTHPLEHDSPPHVPDELLYLFEPELNEVDKTPNEAPVNVSAPPQAPTQKPSSKASKPRQFVPVDESTVEQFVKDQENQGTARKNISDMRTLTQFLQQKNEKREIYKIPPEELNSLLCQYFFSVRKTDGEEYEPSSLRGMMCSFDRILRSNDYGYELSKSVEFAKTRDVLTAKQIALKKMGKGNGDKRAETLTDDDIEAMFKTGQLGLSNPTTLLHTLWFFNTIYFGLRGVTEHYQMTWGDVQLCKDSKSQEYLQMNERNTKTRTGANLKNTREIPQRAWATTDQTKCPVAAYKLYKSKRPTKYSKPEDPFYIQENNNPDKSALWFKAQRIGINKLGKFMKKMALNTGIIKEHTQNDENQPLDDNTNRRLTNHSARRFMLQKLDDEGIEHNHIKQISGHKNIQSITTYSKLNPQKHKQIAQCILGNQDHEAENEQQIQSSQTTRTVTMGRQCILGNQDENEQQIQSSQTTRTVTMGRQAVHQTQTQLVVGQSQSHDAPRSGMNYIFGAPIYGGTFNININNTSPSVQPPQKKRRFVIESDSSQDE